MNTPPPPPPPAIAPPRLPKHSIGPGRPPGTRPIRTGDPALPITGNARALLADAAVHLYATLIRLEAVVERIREHGDDLDEQAVQDFGFVIYNAWDEWTAVQAAATNTNETTNETTNESESPLWLKN